MGVVADGDGQGTAGSVVVDGDQATTAVIVDDDQGTAGSVVVDGEQGADVVVADDQGTAEGVVVVVVGETEDVGEVAIMQEQAIEPQGKQVRVSLCVSVCLHLCVCLCLC